MPKLKIIPRKSISSLISLSSDCVAKNVLLYKDSLQYLPSHIKEKILRKLLVMSKFCYNVHFNQIFTTLFYSTLKYINLSSVPVDDNTLSALRNCHLLTDLNLRNCESQSSFTSHGLRELFQQTPKLLVLDVSYCEAFNDSVLECLSTHCQYLCELCAEGCNITDDGLIDMASKNKQIKCLTVSKTAITGDGISSAVKNKNWKQLQELRLDYCTKVNDDVLKTIIENCLKIEILTFYNCAITDETSIFQDITKTCKKLKQLHWTISW